MGDSTISLLFFLDALSKIEPPGLVVWPFCVVSPGLDTQLSSWLGLKVARKHKPCTLFTGFDQADTIETINDCIQGVYCIISLIHCVIAFARSFVFIVTLTTR